MRPTKAIAVLSIPFAAVTLALLSGMCLTPYWDCSQVPLTIELWHPALFLLVAFTVVAVVVLYVDLLLIREVIHKMGSSRLLALAVLGAITATLPRVILAAFGGLGISSVAPRFEFVPFAVAGALFAIALYKLVDIEQKQ
jgi:hypothetical protein